MQNKTFFFFLFPFLHFFFSFPFSLAFLLGLPSSKEQNKDPKATPSVGLSLLALARGCCVHGKQLVSRGQSKQRPAGFGSGAQGQGSGIGVKVGKNRS